MAELNEAPKQNMLSSAHSLQSQSPREEAADVMVAQPALPGLGRSAEHVSTALLM